MQTATDLTSTRDQQPSGFAEWTVDPLSHGALRTLRLALRTITEALAGELAHPTDAAPQWSPVEWAVARAVAAIHGVSPLLAETLRWPGPAPWLKFLAEQRSRTAARFGRILELLNQLGSDARRASIALVPLKGAALHALGVYRPGARPMADVDVLVQPDQADSAAKLLAACGFLETHQNWKHRVFARSSDAAPEALGEGAHNGIKIELHCRIAEALPRRVVDVSAVIFSRRLQPGLNPYPSRTALLLHLLLHAAGSMAMRQLRLLQLHDIARLASQMSDEDWDDLFGDAACTVEGSLWWGYPPLALATRYYQCVPERILARAMRGCHWLLRRTYLRRTLTDTSLSNPSISAFPGIEFARSAGELLGCVAGRLVPSADTLRMRTELARIQPLISGGTWAHLSQRRRILRWLISRQTRHETLAPVRAALCPASYPPATPTSPV
jgi:hypothetical protein